MKKLIILMAAILLCGWGVNASILAGDKTYDMVTVEDNDTLWDIAARRVNNRVDIRKYIYEVQQLNHIQNPGDIQPGDVIKMPPVKE